MDVITDLEPLSPGLIDELEAYIGPVGENCGFQSQHDARRIGGHQLPDSPPDSGSEHPYSPDSHPIVTPVLTQDYMLVDQLPNPMLPQNEYLYEELKNGSLSDVVIQENIDLGLRGVRHELGLSDRYGYTMRVDMGDLDQGLINPLVIGHEPLTPVYTNLQEPSVKKRKHSQDVSQVKCEPDAHQPRVAPPSVDGSEAGDDATFQCIKFAVFQQSSWHNLYDQNLKMITPPSYVVGADKGFNFSQIDEAFVCQKKNHFQVTCQMHVIGEPQYVKSMDGFKKINSFYLHFYGVKAEDPTQEVRIEQSQSDRTKKPFHPVPVELCRDGTKVTVGRLHFAETTNNNMRKKGRPNPDQRHFQLVVALRAHCQSGEYMIAAQASDRIIVRASNPGQFESDCSESWWQRGVSDNSVHFNGKVGINTDKPDEACVISGNLKVMGHIVHPSDVRAKHNIEELDTAQQLKNVQSIRVVKFNYDPSFAQHSGLVGFDPSTAAPSSDTGVIAQEVRGVLPEAVKEAGDITLHNGHTIHKFLVVNKDRIFMENLGAVKELCKLTVKLESRIDQLEKINKNLYKGNSLHRRDSARSSVSNDSRFSSNSNSSKSLHSDGNMSIDQIRDIARNIRRHEGCHKLSHNSPKYTRKQCKSCHTYSKYGKYYNSNKTNSVRYNKEKDSLHGNDYDTLESKVLPEMKKKESCFWVRQTESEDSFSCGTTKLSLCCRKRNDFVDSELISNKFLQIGITVLIFIMAICLMVMSALYFREHQEVLSMRELRQDKFAQYANYGKFHMTTPPAHYRATPDIGYHNQIQNSKQPQHIAAKKTAKEKGTHKTTPEFQTTPSVSPEPSTQSVPTPPTTPLHASRNYVKNVLNIDQQSAQLSQIHRRISLARAAEVVGSGCALDNALNAEFDVDCQSSCNLDPPQAYENQDPIEKNTDKDLNETTNYSRLEKPIIPIIPDKNSSEQKNEDLKNQLRDELSLAETNLLDPRKLILNSTDNETTRLKRDLRGRVKREANEASQKTGSNEMFLDHQSDEIDGLQDCEIATFGVIGKTFNNDSMFEESICGNAFYNLSYMVPVSKCLKEKHIDISFRSGKFKQIRLCDLKCKYDTSRNCQLNREIGKPILSDDVWSSKMTLECNMDREMKIRAGFEPHKDICFATPEKLPFVEYNIRLHRDCRS